MVDFFNGIAVCSSVTCDRFFLRFAAAFVALAMNWVLLAAYAPAGEYRHLVYVSRLVGFVLILAAIWDKNRNRRASS